MKPEIGSKWRFIGLDEDISFEVDFINGDEIGYKTTGKDEQPTVCAVSRFLELFTPQE